MSAHMLCWPLAFDYAVITLDQHVSSLSDPAKLQQGTAHFQPTCFSTHKEPHSPLLDEDVGSARAAFPIYQLPWITFQSSARNLAILAIW
jgi:hypothetical protein